MVWSVGLANGICQNWGSFFAGPHSKEDSILGSELKSPLKSHNSDFLWYNTNGPLKLFFYHRSTGLQFCGFRDS